MVVLFTGGTGVLDAEGNLEALIGEDVDFGGAAIVELAGGGGVDDDTVAFVGATAGSVTVAVRFGPKGAAFICVGSTVTFPTVGGACCSGTAGKIDVLVTLRVCTISPPLTVFSSLDTSLTFNDLLLCATPTATGFTNGFSITFVAAV